MCRSVRLANRRLCAFVSLVGLGVINERLSLRYGGYEHDERYI